MKDFWGSTKFKILVAILAVMLGFMIASVYKGGTASVFSNIVNTITLPFQRVSASISDSVSDWLQTHTDAEALYEENQELKKEVGSLREQLVDYEKIKHENEQYSEIIDTVKTHDDWTIEPASVIARDSQSRFYSFSIDKGSRNGIEYLDPVITADGLVGYISEVGRTSAKVMTILDVKVDVGAYDSRVRDLGVVSGSVQLAEEGLCAMDYLPRGTQVKKGDLILTSGSLTGDTSMYPKDIIIGKVIRMEPDAHGTNPHAIIQPGVDIPNVKDVFVITDFEGQGVN